MNNEVVSIDIQAKVVLFFVTHGKLSSIAILLMTNMNLSLLLL